MYLIIAKINGEEYYEKKPELNINLLKCKNFNVEYKYISKTYNLILFEDFNIELFNTNTLIFNIDNDNFILKTKDVLIENDKLLLEEYLKVVKGISNIKIILTFNEKKYFYIESLLLSFSNLFKTIDKIKLKKKLNLIKTKGLVYYLNNKINFLEKYDKIDDNFKFKVYLDLDKNIFTYSVFYKKEIILLTDKIDDNIININNINVVDKIFNLKKSKKIVYVIIECYAFCEEFEIIKIFDNLEKAELYLNILENIYGKRFNIYEQNLY